eukprot:1156860-Pelagomonas_calceolata.AAC.4
MAIFLSPCINDRSTHRNDRFLLCTILIGVAGTAYSHCTIYPAASPSLLFVDRSKRCLGPRVAIAGAAVVIGCAGEGVCSVDFGFVGLAKTAPTLGGTVDAVDACSGTAAVCVGGGAGNITAAVGEGVG